MLRAQSGESKRSLVAFSTFTVADVISAIFYRKKRRNSQEKLGGNFEKGTREEEEEKMNTK
jgi:hypothetical protein